MPNPVSAIDVASYIINRCISDERPISNLQLQKILYFCQEESYRTIKAELIADDFEAWRYGPVIPAVYRRFSLWGGKRITWPVEESVGIPDWAKKIIDPTVVKYRGKHPWQLVDETHVQGHPWYTVFHEGVGDGGVIDKNDIRAHALA